MSDPQEQAPAPAPAGSAQAGKTSPLSGKNANVEQLDPLAVSVSDVRSYSPGEEVVAVVASEGNVMTGTPPFKCTWTATMTCAWKKRGGRGATESRGRRGEERMKSKRVWQREAVIGGGVRLIRQSSSGKNAGGSKQGALGARLLAYTHTRTHCSPPPPLLITSTSSTPRSSLPSPTSPVVPLPTLWRLLC